MENEPILTTLALGMVLIVLVLSLALVFILRRLLPEGETQVDIMLATWVSPWRQLRPYFSGQRVARVFYGLLIVLTVGLLATYILLQTQYPAVSAPPRLQVAQTPAALKRGEYLVNHVAHCFVCHSAREEDLFSAPVRLGKEGAGGYLPKEANFFPDRLYPPNLTPFHLADWTDGEIYRAITQGVDKAGAPLHPIMPYGSFSHMQPQDVQAIIAFLRRLPAIQTTVPEAKLTWQERLKARLEPRPLQPLYLTDPTDSVQKGRYLVTIAGCSLCHTPSNERGQADTSRFLGGGNVFTTATGMQVRSANLTPHPSGLGNWSEQAFLNRFAQYRDRNALAKVAKGDFDSVMPWNAFANMEVRDLKAIYAYLRTLKAVDNKFSKIVQPGQSPVSY